MPPFGEVEDVVLLSRRHLRLSEGALRRRARSRPAAADRRINGAMRASSAWRRVAAPLGAASCGGRPAAAQTADTPIAAPELRVCADPNNLPFSNEKRKGFENKIAEVLAAALAAESNYTWFPAGRSGFVRNTLQADRCDLVIGTVAGDEHDADDEALLLHQLRAAVPRGQRALDHGLAATRG